MLKIAGAVLIISGCLGLGRGYLSRYQGRIKALEELKVILELMAGEISYGKATLPECCTHISGYLSAPFSQIFTNIARRMKRNDGLSFGEVFRRESEEGLRSRPLQTKDIDIFWEFTYLTGFSDSQMQLKTIEQSIRKLEAEKEHLRNEANEKCKIAMSLGVMSGLLLVLILW